jgi:hypothetical protein
LLAYIIGDIFEDVVSTYGIDVVFGFVEVGSKCFVEGNSFIKVAQELLLKGYVLFVLVLFVCYFQYSTLLYKPCADVNSVSHASRGGEEYR